MIDSAMCRTANRLTIAFPSGAVFPWRSIAEGWCRAHLVAETAPPE